MTTKINPALPTTSSAPPAPPSPPPPPRNAMGSKGGPFEVSLGSIDEPSLTVYAQYRPKELEVTQSVPWSKHNSKNSQGALQLEFSGAEGRQTSLEMFLDASEIKGGSVAGEVDKLLALARVRTSNMDEKDDDKKRPHHCVLVFGKIYTQKAFRCVIESVSTKYTMFSPEGDPIRATVTLKLKECHSVKMAAAGAPTPAPAPSSSTPPAR
jgi:hypothetical protein